MSTVSSASIFCTASVPLDSRVLDLPIAASPQLPCRMARARLHYLGVGRPGATRTTDSGQGRAPENARSHMYSTVPSSTSMCTWAQKMALLHEQMSVLTGALSGEVTCGRNGSKEPPLQGSCFPLSHAQHRLCHAGLRHFHHRCAHN